VMSEGLAIDTREVPATPRDLRALVAIDLGAESCRVSLLRWVAGHPAIQLVHRFPNQAIECSDGLYWAIDLIWNELERGLEGCAAIADEGIRSIAVDGWAVDYVRLDAQGQAISDPFCYRDKRTLASLRVLHERLPAERMRTITGVQILRINTVYQLLADSAALRDQPWLNLPEYILHRLGGDAVAELTNASHTQMLALDGRWSSEILGAIGMHRDKAPRIVAPGTDLGCLRGRLSALAEFSDTRLIAPACHDTASAVASIPDEGDDWAYLSSGTWSLVGTVLDAPNNTELARVENFTNLRGVEGKFCFHKNVNGMWLLRQCLEAWSEEADAVGKERLTIGQLVDAAAAFAPPTYTLDVDDPDLLLPGQMAQRINEQLRRRKLPVFDTTSAHGAKLASFLFHSLATKYAEALRSISAITGKHLRRLYVMGGGSQNLLLNRLTADATGLQVIRAGTECSTMGNFAVQLSVLAGHVGADMPSVAAWASCLDRW
jgi:rhamnulokinase